MVIGAPVDTDQTQLAGSAYVLGRNIGGPDAWGLERKLLPNSGRSGGRFGDAVAMCGNTIVVGAPWTDDIAGSEAGAAYVFERNEGGPDNWGQVRKLTAPDADELDRFGRSVATCGDTVVVGAYQDGDAGLSSGSAYVFGRDVGGAGNWGFVTKLTASDGGTGDRFGISVAVEGDTIAVGADRYDAPGLCVPFPFPQSCSNSGAVYIFERNAGGSDAWGETTLIAPPSTGNEFGYSVALSGDTLAVGNKGGIDPDFDEGENGTTVFDRNEGGLNAWGEIGAFDGGYLAEMALDGDRVVAGVPCSPAGNDEELASLFDRDAGGLGAWGTRGDLTPFDEVPDDCRFYGRSVAIDGPIIVVGAFGDDDLGAQAGAIYLYTQQCLGGLAPPTDVVDVEDLLALINAWGPCPAKPAPCPADLAEPFGHVDADDLLVLLNAWGECPLP